MQDDVTDSWTPTFVHLLLKSIQTHMLENISRHTIFFSSRQRGNRLNRKMTYLLFAGFFPLLPVRRLVCVFQAVICKYFRLQLRPIRAERFVLLSQINQKRLTELVYMELWTRAWLMWLMKMLFKRCTEKVQDRRWGETRFAPLFSLSL